MAAETPLCLGLEIGGTKLQVGLGRGDGRIVALERRVIRPEEGSRGILEQIAEAYPKLLASPGVGDSRPQSVGIGFGGPVDAVRGVVLRSHQVEGWDGFDLAAWVTRTLQIPRVAIQNDADTAGLGEATQGAGIGLSPVFYVTIGSGIGGGLILDGQIYRGSGFGAAEIGHLWIEDLLLGPSRLEDVASGWAIGRAGRLAVAEGAMAGPLEKIAAGNPSRIDGLAVAKAAVEGDPRALLILSRATRTIGEALAHVVTLVAPRRVILGGGVSMIGENLWFGPIREALQARVFPPFRETFDVVPAALGEEVVIHGALALARELA